MPEQFGDFIARLTDSARTSLQIAEELARTRGSLYVGTEHILLGLLAQRTSVGAKMLADAGVTLSRAEETLGLPNKSLVLETVTKGLSETAMLTLRMAYQQTRDLQQEYLGTEHILYSLLKQKSARATVLLRDMNTNIEMVMEELEAYLGGQSSDYDDVAAEDRLLAAKQRRRHDTVLDTYGIDLTAKAENNELDAVIGRDKEIERVITILTRRTKNNPVLIGEPGVGKTAIVEGLAQRIASGNVPDHLIDQRVIQLDLASMVAGTKYRGEFEERLKRVIDEVKQQKNAVVFIDELHLLVGAGSAEGSMDAANILKPALARGELRLVGATTLDEYRKRIETDSALERRFQAIIVKEPSPSETVQIVRGLKSYYEAHHAVEMNDEVIETAVYLADRYLADRRRPDKALDVIDEAAALTRVKTGQNAGRLRDLRREERQLEEKIEDAVSSEDYERAALYKMRLSRIVDEIEASGISRASVKLTDDNIARAIAMMTGIPVEKVHSSEKTLLTNLEKRLSKYVIGQTEAVHAVAQAIRRGRSGIAHPHRPIGSFIFMGPTGVGKTELARVIAREVFGSESALVKIDMSEFAERHTASRLVGAPAGYVGYEDGGKLTDKIRRQPYSVVLFDEIEKAHPDVFNLLLQLLEDGRLTDAKGREVDFSNTIIILTSNLGSDLMVKESSLGFRVRTSEDKKEFEAVHAENVAAAEKALERFMRPELINRFNAIVTFHALTRQNIQKVFGRLIADLETRLVPKGIGLRVESRAKRWLIDQGFDQRRGARRLRRTIEEYVEHGIAEGIIAGRFKPGTIVVVDYKGNTLTLEESHET